IHDPDKSVSQAIKDAEGKVGASIKVTGFVRYVLGEGIDRPDGRRGRGLDQTELSRPSGVERPTRAVAVSSHSRRRASAGVAMTKPVYRRVVVKVSGEALMGPDSFGIHQPTLERIAADLIASQRLGVAIAVVVGGGNIFRGVNVSEKGIARAT